MLGNRDAKGKFVKGSNPNPSGRPKTAEWFRNEIRKDLHKYKDILYEIIADKKHRDRFRAIELLLAYGLGKPKQGLELTGADENPVYVSYVAGMTKEEIRAIAKEIAEKIEKVNVEENEKR